jgi:hypothetical protein
MEGTTEPVWLDERIGDDVLIELGKLTYRYGDYTSSWIES